jgi:hypothetical protein
MWWELYSRYGPCLKDDDVVFTVMKINTKTFFIGYCITKFWDCECVEQLEINENENSINIDCYTCKRRSVAGIYYLCRGRKENLCIDTRDNRQNIRKTFLSEVKSNCRRKECMYF